MPGSIDTVLSDMKKIRQRARDHWLYFPDPSNLDGLEENITQFFNGIIQHSQYSYLCTRQWTGKAASNPLNGLSGAIWKPNLLLCKEGAITTRYANQQKFNMRTGVYAMGELEVKKTYNEDSKKQSYIELAGKVVFLLEAQDGCYATLGVRVSGTTIVLTLFDQGDSISTHPLDIHQHPEEFLRILFGVTFTDGAVLSFDFTISLNPESHKVIRITKRGKEYEILVDTLLFFSRSLHGWGTTVWSGTVTIDEADEEVVVKDSWVNLLQRYTEGRILKILEEARVKGVPRLVHEQQVQTQHPIVKELVNNSMHILCTLIEGLPQLSYYLHVMSHLISKPRGCLIFDFTSLSELLIGLINCLCSHHDALKKVHILHHDISLFNLLFVLAIHSDLSHDFLDRVLQGPKKVVVQAKIQTLLHRGHLGDWGYAVPTDDSPREGPTPSATGIHVSSGDALLSLPDLKNTHNIMITIPVADKPLPSDSCLSINASPLHRTGTWAWMAVELSHVGPGTPVVHRAHHDLESFFYILLAICLLYDEPGELKPAKVLTQCFDLFFAVTHPSTLKIITIQSNFGWSTLILYISPYFQPGAFQFNQDFTHDLFINSIVVVLAKLPEKYWPAANHYLYYLLNSPSQ
ncbi:hypothetical protein OG21DRAFT_1490718 [Imleria badia]|nr:hypothetical protein OG21DRAFT_1490718 [Imleria badia]